VRILDPKKAQNLAISLKALSVSAQEVCCAVKEGKVYCHASALCKCMALPGCNAASFASCHTLKATLLSILYLGRAIVFLFYVLVLIHLVLLISRL
jgi:hypothetical protein